MHRLRTPELLLLLLLFTEADRSIVSKRASEDLSFTEKKVVEEIEMEFPSFIYRCTTTIFCYSYELFFGRDVLL